MTSRDSELNKNKYLFLIDLDGTLLQNSAKAIVGEREKKAIQRAKDEGHIVCIVTGRPWRSTQKVYEELDLDTVVSNYNGAQIHHPKDYYFAPYISDLNLNDVMYIVGDPVLRNAMANMAFEGPGWVQLERRDENLERVFGFDTAEKFTVGIDIHRLPLKPTGIIIDLKENVKVEVLLDYLERKYGDLVEFSSWSKGDGLTPVIDMTAIGVTKAKVVSLLSRYYKIQLENTVSIGDGFNDVPMFKMTELSAAMANANPEIRKYTTYVTHKTNKEGGVAEFIEKVLDNKDNFVQKLREKRRELHFPKDKTTAHNE